MVKPVHLYELAGFKYLKMMSEISRLNFMNINAYKLVNWQPSRQNIVRLLTVSR